MTMDEQLQNELWDYVYGLLDADDARALEQRITSDPLVARTYAEVRQQADLVNAAARLETTPLSFKSPTVQCAHKHAAKPLPVVRWTVGLATVLLVALGGATWWQCRELHNADALAARDAQFAEQQVRLVVSGPAQIQSQATNYLTIQATNLLDEPVATAVEYEVCDSAGKKLREATVNCAEKGTTLALTPDDLGEARYINFSCPSDAPDQAVRYTLTPAAERFQTQLITDRATYKNGETVFFRSVTLPTLAPQQEREFQLNFSLLPPHENTPQTLATGLTEQGVGNGQVQIPEQWAAGRYGLVAQSATHEFSPHVHWFDVESPQPQLWNKELTFGKRSYSPGEAVELKIAATTEQGEPAKQLQLKLATTLNGEVKKLAEQQAQTDSDGISTFRLQLPADAPLGPVCVQVELTNGVQTESITESFKIDSEIVTQDLASQSQQATLNLQRRVLAANSPIQAYVTNDDPAAKLLLAASCRGALVGQTPLDSTRAEQNVELALAPQAAGVVDVELYDYRDSPPTRLASERLYCPPQHYWNIAAQRIDATTWELQVTDEAGRPGDAVLGVRVTSTGSDALAGDYYFAQNTRDSEAVESDFLTAEDSQDRIALLMTKPLSHTPSKQLSWDTNYLYHSQMAQPSSVPALLVLDNLAAIDARYQSAAFAWREANFQKLQRAAQLLAGGAIVLLLALTMLGVLRLAGDVKVWAPLMACAATVLFISGRWLGYELAPPAEIAIASRTQTPEMTNVNNFFAGTQLVDSKQNASQTPALLGMIVNDTEVDESDMYRFGALTNLRALTDHYLHNSAAKPTANFPLPLRTEFFSESLAATPALPERLARARFDVQQYAAGEDQATKEVALGFTNSETLYWNPLLKTDKVGRAHVRFTLPSSDKPYYLIVDAHGQGRLGSLVLPLPTSSGADAQLTR